MPELVSTNGHNLRCHFGASHRSSRLARLGLEKCETNIRNGVSHEARSTRSRDQQIMATALFDKFCNGKTARDDASGTSPEKKASKQKTRTNIVLLLTIVANADVGMEESVGSRIQDSSPKALRETKTRFQPNPTFQPCMTFPTPAKVNYANLLYTTRYCRKIS